ncbi:uncharacterized protein EMH_0076950 [Eimeria mitis]|uniref:Uncharacterized protein n=1 Tax=Eimeria mitis TaxID=44415 RepID=U6K8Y1_9EIME|nr:uncharacterized protein EMH_0076950 [Eimeria mitis]CDJ32677.1 hypothetical protein, conserved [Eimeria mitis]
MPVPAVAVSGSTVQQQVLLQHQLQQQLEDQLQQLQQLQQQLLQQSSTAQETPGRQGPTLGSKGHPVTSYLNLGDSPSSALALVSSLLGGSAAASLRLPAFSSTSAVPSASRCPEGQQQQATPKPAGVDSANDQQVTPQEFPSVGGVTYNVKGACWEVAVKGRETTKIFSTRKFGGLEAAYGAAVMWKRKVDRGEQGDDDADGPEGVEGPADDEYLDEVEGLGVSASSAKWEAGIEAEEPLRKRAVYSRPDPVVGSVGVAMQQQQFGQSLVPPSIHITTVLDDSQGVQQQLSTAPSV